MTSIGALITKLRMRQLALVVAIADRGGVRTAAESLHVSQPAATKMLREVESTMGTALFERTRGRMRPTAAGEAAIRYARVTVADLRRLHEELGELESGDSGHVSIGSVLAPEPIEVVRALARFKATRPKVTVTLQIGTNDALLPRLLSGELDAVIGRMASRAELRQLEFHELAQERLALIAGSASPLAHKRWTAQELQPLQWVLLPAGTPLRRALEEAFRHLGVVPPESAVETNSMFTVLSLLRDSEMISAVSERTAKYFAQTGDVVLLDSSLQFQLEPYGILRRKGRPVTSATHELLERIKEEMAQ
jgi:DNA-binding transcriptional LysR family regulator